MPAEFSGTGLPLSPEGLAAVTDKLGVYAAEIWAVLTVETRGCGFLADRRPLILFERHVFRKETRGKFDKVAPEVSQPTPGGYDSRAGGEYKRLGRAIQLDRTAALRSASWGIGQVMGFNAQGAGYPDVETFVAAMCESENAQLAAMAGEIVSNRLDGALRSHDWPSFARGYNGSQYARNQYDTRLMAAYHKFAMGILPDVTLRQAQICLLYLGYDPGPVDGVTGRRTRSALEAWQKSVRLPSTGDPDPTTLDQLRAATFKPVVRAQRGRPVRATKRGQPVGRAKRK
jgi:hypothetical protein